MMSVRDAQCTFHEASLSVFKFSPEINIFHQKLIFFQTENSKVTHSSSFDAYAF